MKIHFFGSLTGNKMKAGNKTHYEKIVETIEKLGYEVITTHSVTKKLEDVLKEPIEHHKEYIKKMKSWIKKADIIVAEVTRPEIGTGYELALAVDYGKPVVALYTNGQDSPILAGQESDQIQHLEYDSYNLERVLKDALKVARTQMDVRFNFFISPKIGCYLDWIAKKKKVPRAVYLRRLIEEEMKKSKEYKS